MNRTNAASLVIVLALVILECIGFFHPGSLNWGFHFLGFLPPVFFVFYLILAAAGISFSLRGNPLKPVTAAAHFMEKRPWGFLGIALGIFFLCAAILRIKVPLLGDGMYIVKNFAEVSRGESFLYPRSEPFATYGFYFLMRLLEKQTYAGLLNAFWIGGLVCGMGFIISAFLTLKSVVADPIHRLLAFLLVVTLPYMQLFFGYVETYSPVLFVLSLFILAGVRTLQGKLPFAVAAALFTIQTLVHYVTVLILPAIAYLAYREYKRSGWKQVAPGAAAALVIVFLTLLALGFNTDKLFTSTPQDHFLTLARPADFFNDYSQAYILFSPYHALDLLNYGILMAAAPVVLLLLTLRKSWRLPLRSPEVVFLLLLVVPVGGFLFVARFDLAAARDWDVVSMYFYPFALMAALAFLQSFGLERLRSYCLLLVIPALNSLAMFSVNASTDASLRRFTALPDKRNFSALAYYSAYLGLSLYYHQADDHLSPITMWKHFTSEYPQDPRGYLNIINNFKRLPGTPIDTITAVYELWLRQLPDDSLARKDYADFSLGAGNGYFARGALDSAGACYRRAIALDPLDARAYNNLGSVYARAGHADSALAFFNGAIALDSSYSDPFYNLASAYEDLGDHPRSLAALKEAARLGNSPAQAALKEKGIAW